MPSVACRTVIEELQLVLKFLKITKRRIVVKLIKIVTETPFIFTGNSFFAPHLISIRRHPSITIHQIERHLPEQQPVHFFLPTLESNYAKTERSNLLGLRHTIDTHILK